MLFFEERIKNSMGHFKEIETGSINILFPHIGSNKWHKKVEQIYKYEIYIKIILRKYNIPSPPIPIPGVATKVLPTALFIFRLMFDDLLLFLLENEKMPGRTIERKYF